MFLIGMNNGPLTLRLKFVGCVWYMELSKFLRQAMGLVFLRLGHTLAWADLEVTLQSSPPWNSQCSSCLILLSTGMTPGLLSKC